MSTPPYGPGCAQSFRPTATFTFVAEAANGREAIDLVRNHPIDVLILDLSMPERSGMDVLATVRIRAPRASVLILSGHSEDQYAVALIRRGASGYHTKDCDPIDIVTQSARSILDGGTSHRR